MGVKIIPALTASICAAIAPRLEGRGPGKLDIVVTLTTTPRLAARLAGFLLFGRRYLPWISKTPSAEDREPCRRAEMSQKADVDRALSPTAAVDPTAAGRLHRWQCRPMPEAV